MDDEAWKGWTKEERIEFVREFYLWMKEPEEANEGRIDLEDFCIMNFLAYKLRQS